MFHDKNNEIFKKLVILNRLTSKQAFYILADHNLNESFNTVIGWLYSRNNPRYRKMPYRALVLFLDALIEKDRSRKNRDNKLYNHTKDLTELYEKPCS